jgi:GT2 family glycosyltransferase
MEITTETAAAPLVTILLPHYKTLALAKLCLRSLKMHTDLNKVKVIVIDNNSGDESLDYLRSIKWITLIERKDIAGDEPAAMHSKALDLGMKSVDTPYVLSIHTDTIVTNDSWLDFLISKIEQSDKIAGVGSWKLEYVSPLKRFGKTIEEAFQTRIWFPLIGKKHSGIIGENGNFYYLRSHCALYRTDLIRKYTNGFFDEQQTAGKVIHRKLVENGFQMIFIEPMELFRYMKHLNHATMILNPEIAGKKTGTKKAYTRIMNEIKAVHYDKILNDESLD